ncbi:MAG TPA: ribose 5-phosphate isomerase B [bacterium]|nr:ribose 5-phosphate isomerase B [bacterium]
MRIVLASDHAGFAYKELLKAVLAERGHAVLDAGAHSTDPVDYPDFIGAAAKMVQAGQAQAGVVFGGSGNGEAMAANRFHGVRAAVAWNRDSARLGKQHNNANVLSIGQRMVPQEELVPIVDAWLDATFEQGRHLARLEKLELLGP